MARIVVVDDDPDILNIVCMSLEAMGHEVERAGNGREGVDLVRSSLPDLVLMDVMMPDMNGYEATATLKADVATAPIPVLALTAKAMRGDEERGREAGMDAYITKPFRLSHMLDVVDRFLGRADRPAASAADLATPTAPAGGWPLEQPPRT